MQINNKMARQLIQGKYKILSLIGRGGMGAVYRVMHEGLKREDALKKLHEQYAEEPGFVDRFMREARAMARLDHPNIIRIYDVFEEDDANYIAMEYFAGESLSKVLHEKKILGRSTVIHIMKQLASALAYAHEQGIVHRDIKPGNILVKPDNTVKIADFGIAAVADDLTLTSTGQMVGSPRYMSPEQARGEAMDHRSDLFSLGVVFFQMLTGKLVFDSDSTMSVISKLAFGTEEFPIEFSNDIPESLQNIVRKLLQRKPQDRYQTANELLNALESLDSQQKSEADIEEVRPDDAQATVVRTKPVTIPGTQAAKKKPTPNRMMIGAVAASLVVIVLAVILMMLPENKNKDLEQKNTQSDIAGHAQQVEVESASSSSAETSSPSTSQVASSENQEIPEPTLEKESLQNITDKPVDQIASRTESTKKNTEAELSDQVTKDLKKLDGDIALANKSKKLADRASAKTYASKDYNDALQKLQSVNNSRDQAVKAKTSKNYAQSQKLIEEALALASQTRQAFDASKQIAENNRIISDFEKDRALMEDLQKRTLTIKQNAIKAGASTGAREIFQSASAEEIQAEQYAAGFIKNLEQNKLDAARQSLNNAYKKYQAAHRLYEDSLGVAGKAQPVQSTKAAVTTDEFEVLQRMFHELSVAYENKDYNKLQKISQMSGNRSIFVKRIFDRYEKIDVSIVDIRLSNDKATANLIINKLIKSDGHITLPADIWKSSALEVNKQADGWSKIKW